MVFLGDILINNIDCRHSFFHNINLVSVSKNRRYILSFIAQKNQVEILFKNLRFLKERGYVILTVKSRSIDVTKQPSKIFREVEEKLKQKLRIIDQKELDPFEKDHALFICQKK